MFDLKGVEEASEKVASLKESLQKTYRTVVLVEAALKKRGITVDKAFESFAETMNIEVGVVPTHLLLLILVIRSTFQWFDHFLGFWSVP